MGPLYHPPIDWQAIPHLIPASPQLCTTVTLIKYSAKFALEWGGPLLQVVGTCLRSEWLGVGWVGKPRQDLVRRRRRQCAEEAEYWGGWPGWWRWWGMTPAPPPPPQGARPCPKSQYIFVDGPKGSELR